MLQLQSVSQSRSCFKTLSVLGQGPGICSASHIPSLIQNPLIKNHLYFLSLRVFRQLSSSLLLHSQLFGQYVLRPSSGVFIELEPAPLFNPRGSLVLIPLTITGYKCKIFMYCYSPTVRIEPTTSRWLSL